MFVQVIEGQAVDKDQVHEALDRWQQELAPGAAGWIGTTAGVTDDGRFIALACFESEDDAHRNSDRPEQDRWWREFSQNLSGEATFRDTTDVVVDTVGDPNRAGFVQVMKGAGTNPDRARELMSQDSEEWAAYRPDILGSVAALHSGGEYTMAIYFTSEAEARVGEQKEPPPELREQMAELDAMSTGVPEFLDIREPWVYSPR